MKTVIFDFDGTIADTFVLAKEILNKLAPKYGYGPFSDQDIVNLRSMSAKEIVRQYKISRFTLLRMVWDAHREVAKKLASVALFPGFSEALKQIHEDGNHIAIISANSTKNIKTFLAANNISYIDDVRTSLNPFGKARLVKKYIRKESFVPENAVYIGDEVRDYDTAIEAGVRSILVTWGYNSRELLKETGTTLVDTPADLPTALRALR